MAPIRIQAEKMKLTNYRMESSTIASGGSLISFNGGASGETGSASLAFNGPLGTYDVVVVYHDENDGVASLETRIGGVSLDAWNLDQNLGRGVISSENRVSRTVAKGLSIKPGDLIEILGKENASEHARVDYIEFIPVAPPSGPDTTAPTASLTASNLSATTGNVQPYRFSVQYADNVAVNASSLDSSDIRVTGPNGFEQLATLVSVDANTNGSPRSATYEIVPPQGNWDLGDNGTYTVSLASNQVSDTSGNSAASANLGNFQVTVADPVAPAITGELKKWHKIDLTFDGPQTSETATLNPFLNYRLDVTFTNGNKTYVVPGYYAADGNAAETSAASGNKWRVHFTPDEVGAWSYSVSFRQGENVAVSLDPNAGTATSFDGTSGSFTVGNTDKAGRDHRSKGRLEYVGEHYLQFAETDEYFIKGGADSPENFLGYYEFDNTFDNGGAKNDLVNGLHRYTAHVNDWKEGDPTWKDGKGKGIIGALNYLASEEMNSVYFLTYNLDGDGREVWPWSDTTSRSRFDVSKLDQWEIVFSHMDKSGIMLHVVTQEMENDQKLNGGALGTERKLYYRELVARFGHHLAMTWNLGEENTNTDQQRKDFAQYIRDLDPYDHPIVVHTGVGAYDEVYNPLLGFEDFEGASLQTSNTHEETKKWVARSAEAGRPWIVSLDENGPFQSAVKPDADDPTRDGVRKPHLWGNLMAGGAGVEWYFGYDFPHNDLDAEDWRTRDTMWDQTRYALNFFQEHLPFTQMQNNNTLTSVTDDYVFAKVGQVYAVYLPNGGTTNIDLASGNYTVKWYNPRTGGSLQAGTVTNLSGGSMVSIGEAPSETSKDWVALIEIVENPVGTNPSDQLVGNSGVNVITGGVGADVLTGSSSVDRFVYNSSTQGTDIISDFSADDLFEISAAGFGGGLVSGASLSDGIAAATGTFVRGTTPVGTSANFLYSAGTLNFDPDGIGSQAAVALATLTGEPSLDASQLVVVS